MAFLVAYLDESSDERKERYFSVGGFMAEQGWWLEFEKLWNPTADALRNKSAIFHTTDLESTGGDFQGWDHAECKGIVQKMVSCLEKPSLYGCNASVDVAAFERVFPIERNYDRSLYKLCFVSCVQQIAEWGESVNEPVAFVFDHNPPVENRAQREYDMMRHAPNWTASKYLGSITFASKADHIGLQAADFIAYESFKLLDNFGKRDVRRSLARIAETQRLQGRFWDEYNLSNLRQIIAESKSSDVEHYVSENLGDRNNPFRLKRIVMNGGKIQP